MGFPMILLALMISSVLGGGIQNVIIALSVATIPGYCRVICGMTLAIRENDYILAQRALGSRDRRIIFQHILPNSLPPMIVLITLQLGSLILAEAGLSFLGIGIKPPGAAWGAMVSDGYAYLVDQPGPFFRPRPGHHAGGFCFQPGWRWTQRCPGSTFERTVVEKAWQLNLGKPDQYVEQYILQM